MGMWCEYVEYLLARSVQRDGGRFQRIKPIQKAPVVGISHYWSWYGMRGRIVRSHEGCQWRSAHGEVGPPH